MNWTITRQELVVFHARHKRIRIICGHEGLPDGRVEVKNKPFAQYREHAESILGALWDIFKDFPKGSEITPIKHSRPTGASPSCSLKIEKIPRNLCKEVLLAYLEYWRLCLKYEGWEDHAIPNKIVQELINKTRRARTGNGVKITDTPVSRQDIGYLISTLPISPQWDLWGVFSDDPKEKPSTLDSKKKNSTLLEKMKDYLRPVYAAQLKYKSPTAPKDALSRGLLGYPARLRACYADSGRDGVATTFVSEMDYYDYCYRPKEEGKERDLYRAYALLYDALTLALSGEKKTYRDKEKVVFYIAYQIKTSLDRYHFWHIWLRPDDPENATLEQLWTSWWPLHRQILDWPILHTSLATELEQLDIAYAQGEILSDIISKSKSSQFSTDEIVREHAYMLFPMSCVCDEQRWGYRPYYIDENPEVQKMLSGSDSHRELELGMKWDNLKQSRGTHEFCSSCNEYKKYNEPGERKDTILFYHHNETAKDNLQRRRYRRLIEQQRALAEQMLGAHTHQTNLRTDEIQNMLAKLRVSVMDIKPEERRTAVEQLLKNMATWRDCDLKCSQLATIRSAYISNKEQQYVLEHKERPSDEELRTDFILLLETDLHTFISWYLESEPVLALTHARDGQNFDDDFYSYYQTLHSSYVGTIKSLLSTAAFRDCKDYKYNFEQFMNMLEAEFRKKNRNPSIESNAEARDKLRSRAEQVFEQLKELTTISDIKHPESGNDQMELHLPLPHIWELLKLNQFLGSINKLKQTTPTVCLFRLQLADTQQTKPLETTIRLYRNCVAIAYNGENFIEKREKDPKCHYPSAVDQVVISMKTHQVGRLFLGVKKDQSWEYWQITNTDASVRFGTFWPANASGLESWLLSQVNAKSLIMLISFDGWDAP